MGAKGKKHERGSDSLPLVAIDSEPVGGGQVSTNKRMQAGRERVDQ